jgi:hypothetical protein
MRRVVGGELFGRWVGRGEERDVVVMKRKQKKRVRCVDVGERNRVVVVQ